ncbi:ABC transporter permease [Kribbella ginsengisoli]|uniref:ABC-2 family transporter protein n=1 Tax=Kribbella ginsengisoli TaxID=363865 RepID=A0ABP6YKL7_9ACTN
MRTVRILRVLIARELTTTLTYRWWLLFLQLATVISPAISLLVWRGAIAQGATPPVTESFLTTYLVMVGLVVMLTASWTSGFMAESIRLGKLTSWLVRPCSTHLANIANNLGEKLIKLLLAVPLAVGLGIIFRDQVKLPSSPGRWLAFAIALTLAGGMAYTLDVVIGSLAFWFEDVTAVNRLRFLVSGLLSGAIIPLALFPSAFAGFLAIQPFRFMVSFPLEVLLGHPTAGSFAWQAGWSATFLGAAILTWRLGLRSYQGAGA